MEVKKGQFNRPKPVVLAILDGWGIYQTYNGNAIALAKTPTIDSLAANYPATVLHAAGEAVGLPWGEEGNSEVGHLNLGLGRVVYQDLPRINRSIQDNSFYRNQVLLEAVAHVKKHNSKLHILGLVSNGGVHSSVDHLHALLILAKQNAIPDVYIHAFLDGRDTPYNSALNILKGINYGLKEYGVGAIATISGRFYAMDRNNNWDRTERAYLAMTAGQGAGEDDPIQAVDKSYRKKVYDEEIIPTVIRKNGQPTARIEDGDAVIFFNFRPDRARQITKAFILEDFDKFERPHCLNDLFYVCFTEYEKDLSAHVAFPPEVAINSLGDVIAGNGLKQLRIAETEKYAHVTYFFNGGRESRGEGEDHILVPSLNLPGYDQKPEMSAPEVTAKLIKAIEKDIYDFILVNYANADMVGHTGNMQAAMRAITTVDKMVERLLSVILEKNGVLLITADHGNAEIMFNMQSGEMDKEHSANPVPLIIAGRQYEGRNIGWPNVPGGDLTMITPFGMLSDVAPTILAIMGLAQPKEMTGRSLIRLPQRY